MHKILKQDFGSAFNNSIQTSKWCPSGILSEMTIIWRSRPFKNWMLLRLIKSILKLLIGVKTIGVRLDTPHLWPFSKSKFNLKSARVNLVAPASPIECLLYLPNVRAIQYKLGPERLTHLGNCTTASRVNFQRLIVCYGIKTFV